MVFILVRIESPKENIINVTAPPDMLEDYDYSA